MYNVFLNDFIKNRSLLYFITKYTKMVNFIFIQNMYVQCTYTLRYFSGTQKCGTKYYTC